MPPRDQRSGINRGFTWLRKVLEITEETDAPSVLSEIVRPSMDLFGWERLGGVTEFDSSGAAAPAQFVNGPTTPDDVLRLYVHASVVHTDTGVTKFLWIEKQLPITTSVIGCTVPQNVPINVDVGSPDWIWVEAGARLRGRSDINLVAGALVLDLNFIDLPIGEYIP